MHPFLCLLLFSCPSLSFLFSCPSLSSFPSSLILFVISHFSFSCLSLSFFFLYLFCLSSLFCLSFSVFFFYTFLSFFSFLSSSLFLYSFLSLSFFFLPFYFFTFLPLKIPFSQNNKVKYHILWMPSQIFCVLLPTNQLNLNKQQ